MLNGDAETACSVIELSTGKFDQGRILYQVKIGVEPEENAEDLRARLSVIGADAIAHATLQFEDLRSTAIRQADTGYKTSSAPKLKKVISDLDFEQLSKKEVYRIYRAVGHSFPLRVLWNGEQPLMLKKLAPENTPIPTFSADARAAAAPGASPPGSPRGSAPPAPPARGDGDANHVDHCSGPRTLAGSVGCLECGYRSDVASLGLCF